MTKMLPHNEQPTAHLPEIPLDRLASHVLDEGADYNDGIFGYAGGEYDAQTGVITMFFQRDGELCVDNKGETRSITYSDFDESLADPQDNWAGRTAQFIERSKVEEVLARHYLPWQATRIAAEIFSDPGPERDSLTDWLGEGDVKPKGS